MSETTDISPKNPAPLSPNHIVPVGYLRAFVTLLVVAHHAVLAYHPFAPAGVASLVAQPRWWQAFPVADLHRSDLIALFVAWNDTFFMALMFFLSGLFVSRSLGRQGPKNFLKRRFKRLGIPFLAVAGVVAPLAYYPTYLGTELPTGISGFVREWLAMGNWPAGPAWFLWMLIAFAGLAAGLFALRPTWAQSAAERLSGVMSRPLLAFSLLVASTALTYMPVASAVHPLHWSDFGPFFFQTSRLLPYALYFFAGIVVGAHGLDKGLLNPEGRLARRWPIWLGASLAAFIFSLATAIASFAEEATAMTRGAANFGFVISCAASCFALLALFLRFARTPRPLFNSLDRNAYGMYLVHYAFASWLQYAVLDLPLSAMGKALLVVVTTVLLSWATTVALRRVPGFRQIL